MGITLSTIERAAHLIGTYLERCAGELGITQGEAHVLGALTRHGPTPIGLLHREFGHKRSTLTNIVDRLEQRALVRREINPSDRRSVLVSLTASGEHAAGRVTAVLDGLEHQLRASITDRDVEGLENVSHALASAVHQLDEPNA